VFWTNDAPTRSLGGGCCCSGTADDSRDVIQPAKLSFIHNRGASSKEESHTRNVARLSDTETPLTVTLVRRGCWCRYGKNWGCECQSKKGLSELYNDVKKVTVKLQ
jgi:hypothetical protein